MKTHVRTLSFVITFLLLGSLSQAAILKFGGPIDGAQAGTDSAASGSATLCLDTETNTFDLTIHIVGLENELTASHIHAAPADANGPVIVDIGAADVYDVLGTFYSYEATGVDFPPEELVNLLAGNTYLNFHNEAFPPGEVRGQLLPMEPAQANVANMSTRGMVNPGNGKAGLLISGLVIHEPTTIFFRMMADSLTRFGVQTSLKDTSFEIYKLNEGDLESADLVGGNDNWQDDGQKFKILATGLAPGSDNESALILDLEPGSYTLNANSEKGAGIALVETYGMTAMSMSDSINGAAAGDLSSEFTILAAALEATGLDMVLNGPGPFTLFAPTDEAFLAAFTQEELDELLADDGDMAEDIEAVTGLLLAHVVGGSILSSDLTEDVNTELTSLMDTTLDVLLSGGVVTVNNATVIEADMATTNGVIHVIDAVLE